MLTKQQAIDYLESQDFYEICQSYRHAKDGVEYGAGYFFEILKRVIIKSIYDIETVSVPTKTTEPNEHEK
jgi:hypothetical protein